MCGAYYCIGTSFVNKLKLLLAKEKTIIRLHILHDEKELLNVGELGSFLLSLRTISFVLRVLFKEITNALFQEIIFLRTQGPIPAHPGAVTCWCCFFPADYGFINKS